MTLNNSDILSTPIYVLKTDFYPTWEDMLTQGSYPHMYAGQERHDIAAELVDLFQDWANNGCAWFTADEAEKERDQESGESVRWITPLEAADKVIAWRDEYLLGNGGVLLTPDNWFSLVKHSDQQSEARQAITRGDDVIYLEDVDANGRLVRILNVGDVYMIADNGPSIVTTARSFDEALARYNTGEIVAP